MPAVRVPTTNADVTKKQRQQQISKVHSVAGGAKFRPVSRLCVASKCWRFDKLQAGGRRKESLCFMSCDEIGAEKWQMRE